MRDDDGDDDTIIIIAISLRQFITVLYMTVINITAVVVVAGRKRVRWKPL